MKIKMKKDYLKYSSYFLILVLQIACSSSGVKSSGANTSLSRPEGDTSEGGSFDSSGGSQGQTINKGDQDDVITKKKELYDGLQITLGGNDEGIIEKTVANILSYDQGDSKALNTLALYHYSKGRYTLAKMIFKNIIEKDSKNAIAHNNLGVLYLKNDEYNLAIESFRKAVSINPNYPIANANLGCIFATGKDYAKAKHFLEVAYRGGIKDLTVLNNFAVSLMEEGSTQAESVFKEGLQIGASDSNLYYNYALYLTYVKKDYKEASALIDKIRFMGPPQKKKQALAKMEETISGSTSEENKR